MQDIIFFFFCSDFQSSMFAKSSSNHIAKYHHSVSSICYWMLKNHKSHHYPEWSYADMLIGDKDHSTTGPIVSSILVPCWDEKNKLAFHLFTDLFSQLFSQLQQHCSPCTSNTPYIKESHLLFQAIPLRFSLCNPSVFCSLITFHYITLWLHIHSWVGLDHLVWSFPAVLPYDAMSWVVDGVQVSHWPLCNNWLSPALYNM